MEEKYCQSCAMPMGSTDEFYGTEADGSKSKDYCKYCYEGGRFNSAYSMGELIELCIPHMVSSNAGMSEDEARSMMNEYFPQLKRWKQN